ncbi:histidine kinase N-terminal 7TM domain-containing protein [Candidatus Margulisiibacteriota bacterium]
MVRLSLVIAAFLGALTCLSVAFYAIIKNPRSQVNRAWGILSFFVGIMCIGWAMILSSNNLAQAHLGLNICFLGGFFVPSAFLDFVFTFLGKDKRRLIKGSYLLSFILWLLFLAGYSASINYKPALGIYYWEQNYSYHFYPVHLFFSAVYGEYLLYKELARSHGIKRNQILYLFSGSLIGFAAGSTSFLTAYNIPVIPFGLYTFFLYPLVIAYAMVRYRLMDISVVIRKSLVYSLVIGVFTGIYVAAIFLFGQFLQGLTGGAYLILILLSIIIFAIALQPLRNHLQTQIDKLFFKEKYNYQKTLKDLSHASTSIISLPALLSLVSKSIVDRIKIEKTSIYVFNPNSLTFNLKESYIKED